MRLWHLFLFLALLLGFFCSPFASRSPDGLERVAIDHGFIHKGEAVLFNAPFADYRLASMEDERASTAVSGFVGALVVFAAMGAVGTIIKKR